jgi:hypothetical protein
MDEGKKLIFGHFRKKWPGSGIILGILKQYNQREFNVPSSNFA